MDPAHHTINTTFNKWEKWKSQKKCTANINKNNNLHINKYTWSIFPSSGLLLNPPPSWTTCLKTIVMLIVYSAQQFTEIWMNRAVPEASGTWLTLWPAHSLGCRSLFVRTGNITSQIHQAVAMVICSEHIIARLRPSEAEFTSLCDSRMERGDHERDVRVTH